MANRKKAEAEVIKYMTKLEGGGTENAELYKQLFKGMSDKEFDEWIGRIEREDEYLSMIVPNNGSFILDAERSMAVGNELGVEYFQRLLLTDHQTGDEYMTPMKYLVIDVPVRRQNQHLIKKISLPDGDKITDHLTGQVTGDSKGSKISLPEMLTLEARQLDQSILEFIKVRGGDDKAIRAMKDSIRMTGGYTIDSIQKLKTKPTATKNLRAILLAMHLDNTIGKQ